MANMETEYLLPLKANDEKIVDRTSVVFCLITIIALLFHQIINRKVSLLFTFVAFALCCGIVLNRIVQNEGKQSRYKIWLLIAGIAWLEMPWLSWLCVFYFMLAAFEYQIKFAMKVGFSREMVIIHTLFKKRYEWRVFNNIILKDGLLTLDFKNNRLFQKETVIQNSFEIKEDEFNRFCRDHITSLQVKTSCSQLYDAKCLKDSDRNLR